MFLNTRKNKTQEIVDVIHMPVEYNVDKGFVAEYIGSTVLMGPDLEAKFRHHIVRRLDNDQLEILHPIWYGLAFRKDPERSVYDGLELNRYTLFELFYK